MAEVATEEAVMVVVDTVEGMAAEATVEAEREAEAMAEEMVVAAMAEEMVEEEMAAAMAVVATAVVATEPETGQIAPQSGSLQRSSRGPAT